MGLSINQTIVGAMLLVFGFVTYYCVPLTFFYHKTQWFFFIFDALLLMIILGLAFMSVLIFQYVEKGLLWLLMRSCARRDCRLETLISKNLDGHRKRNSKTSIMFTLALSFLIFAASSFKLINQLIESEVESMFGADVYVTSSYGSSSNPVFIDEGPIRSFLQDQKDFDGSVDGWSFVSAGFGVFTRVMMDSDSYFLNINDITGYYSAEETNLYSVPENYLSTINSEFYFPSSTQPGFKNEKVNGYYNAVDMLYSSAYTTKYPSTSEDIFNIVVTANSTSQANNTNFT